MSTIAIDKTYHNIESKSILNYVLMYFIFALGGVPFFSVPKEFKVAFVVLGLIVFLIKNKKFDLGFGLTVLALSIIFILQALFFGGGTVINLGYMFIIFTIPYLYLKIVGKDFYKYYVNIMYFFAVVGLVFYTFSLISPAFHNFTSQIAPRFGTDPTPLPDDYISNYNKILNLYKQSFIVYTYEPIWRDGEILRSPGPFWEPGAYATFLILALIFNMIQSNKFFNKKSIVIIIALLTTFSTAGYIALFALIVSYIISHQQIKISKVPLLIFFISLGIIVYFSQSFLYDKIVNIYLNESTTSLTANSEGRILSARRALISITQYPLFGRGLVNATQAEFGSMQAIAYGIPAMMVRLGIPLFFLVYYFWVKGFKKICINENSNLSLWYGSVVAITAVLFAQSLYFSPIYLMVFYYPVCFSISEYQQNTR